MCAAQDSETDNHINGGVYTTPAADAAQPPTNRTIANPDSANWNFPSNYQERHE
jgi:hypothetical protein